MTTSAGLPSKDEGERKDDEGGEAGISKWQDGGRGDDGEPRTDNDGMFHDHWTTTQSAQRRQQQQRSQLGPGGGVPGFGGGVQGGG